MISIIVPVYNAEKYLERCLSGLLNQSYEHTEIILIDDGSTDSSGQICDTFSNKYGKIRTVHVKNGGASAARNRGIEEAKGEYFTFVDADDCVDGNMLLKLMTLMEETGCDVAGCGYYSFSSGEPKYVDSLGAERTECLTGGEFIKEGLLNSDTRCWSKLYRKEKVGSLRFDQSLTIGEDMLFLLGLAKKGASFARTDYRGYGYYINEAGAMHQGFKDSYMDQITCWQKAAKEIKSIWPELEKRVVSILMVSVMLTVGKLALLDRENRRTYTAPVVCCFNVIKECMNIKGAFKELPPGYKVKITVFRICPRLYLAGYSFLKRKKLQ